MRLNMAFLVGLCACVLLASIQPAAASVTTYLYDFNSLDPDFGPVLEYPPPPKVPTTFDGFLHGQDNWTTNYSPWAPFLAQHCFLVSESPVGGAPHPGDGYVVGNYGWADSADPPHTHRAEAKRTNDANWSFDLTPVGGETTFAFGASFAMDYEPSGWYGWGKFFLNDSTSKGVGFGINVEKESGQFYYRVCIFDATSPQIDVDGDDPKVWPGKHLGGGPAPTQKNQIWDYRMEVDTAANEGEGSGSLFTKHRDVHTEWQPVDGLQDINLQLAAAGADMMNADQLCLEVRTRIASFDNLWIEAGEPTTADLTIKKFFDCNLDNTKNGEDKYLSGWQINVSNVADGGSYDEDYTTDVNGEINLAGLDKGQYDITETPKGTGWVLASANPITIDLSGNTTVDFGNQLPGDANQDEKVNLADFTILKAHFGEDPAGWTFGNYNDDTIVNLADFTILKAYFGEGAPSAGGAAIPEPATALLVFGGCATLVLRRKRD